MSILSEETLRKFHAIIPAGGSGTRLWPLSRAAAPKFLHDLTGSGDTLLRSTWERLNSFVEEKNIVVVTGNLHEGPVKQQIPELLQENLILEAEPKDSAAAICLAAAILQRRHGNIIVGSFAADHTVENQNKFHSSVIEAIEAANRGYIATIGISPKYPATGFGYLKQGEPLGIHPEGTAHKVLLFKEKPNESTAQKYVASGSYFWNAGMFISKVTVLLEQLKISHPNMHDSILEIAKHWDTPKREEVVKNIWHTIPKLAIDYAIAEPAAEKGIVVVIPGDFGWDDMGDFSALARINLASNPGEEFTIVGEGVRVLSDTSSGIVVSDTKKLVALIGMEDIVVVDTVDALLVTTKSNSQKVKHIVDSLKRSGDHDML